MSLHADSESLLLFLSGVCLSKKWEIQFYSLDWTDPGTSKYAPIGIHLLLPHVDYVKKSLKTQKR